MSSLIEKQKKTKEIKRKRIFIVCACVLVCSLAIGIVLAVRNKDEGDTASATDNNNQEQQQIEEKPKYENSGYLKLEDDPNAEDAEMVSENTNGLLKGEKTYPVRTDGKKVAYLTFDDGPSTTNTENVLKVLDDYDVKATFFIMGSQLNRNDESKEILKEIAKNGHAIGNHTYSHDYKYLYPGNVINVDNFTADVEKNNELMQSVLGKDFSTRVIRFPGGYWSWQGRVPMKEKIVEKGYCNIDWNALNRDAEGSTKNADQLVEEAKKTVSALGPDADSVVILMHDTYGKEETVKALPRIIEYLQSEGFIFKTIK